MELNKLKEIASMFQIDGTVESVEPMGEGLINDTFRVRVSSPDAPGYVLQRINHNIFTDVEALQRNISRVTAHIRAKLVAAGVSDPDRRVLSLIPVRNSGKTYVEVDGNYWRMTLLIAGSRTISEVTPATARLTGEAIGEFQTMLADLPGEPLAESIPRFHDMEYRLAQLDEAVAADAAGRLSRVSDIVEQIRSMAHEMTWAEREYRAGRLPKRVCHCDTKVSNLLFDSEGRVLCVIDLDTLMPSFISSDYGDFLRTAAATAPEDEPDLERIDVRPDIIEAFTEGYLSSATFLTPAEKELLPRAIAMFPYMQAVRFLTDYLNGDTYYKTQYPEHNLVRTRAQLRLLERVRAVMQNS